MIANDGDANCLGLHHDGSLEPANVTFVEQQ
jgi:hypothetical protein